MKQFYFLRHGQTDFNKDGLWTGSTDVALNEAGEAEIISLVKKIKRLNIKYIYASPLKRAKKTANIINKVFNAAVVIDGNLSERSFGIFEGTKKSINSRSLLDVTESVEVKSEFLARVMSFISNTELGEDVLIVSHSGVFKALIELGFKSTNIQIKNAEFVLMQVPEHFESV